MTRHMNVEQLVASAVAPPMTRKEKIERWASLVERLQDRLYLFHNLEHMMQKTLDAMEVTPTHPSAFGLAVGDAVFQEAGLTDHTVGGCQRFFELSQDELHEFSCDCGGGITTKEMAGRMMCIASGESRPVSRSRLFSHLWQSRFRG